MQELEQTLKGNWHPPKNNNSKRTVINFIVAKDGNFNNLRIIKSSGIEQVDEAALNAVQKSAPFKPLPKEYNGEYVPIEFVFDYNVIYAWSSDVKDRCKTKFCKFMQKY